MGRGNLLKHRAGGAIESVPRAGLDRDHSTGLVDFFFAVQHEPQLAVKNVESLFLLVVILLGMICPGSTAISFLQ